MSFYTATAISTWGPHLLKDVFYNQLYEMSDFLSIIRVSSTGKILYRSSQLREAIVFTPLNDMGILMSTFMNFYSSEKDIADVTSGIRTTQKQGETGNGGRTLYRVLLSPITVPTHLEEINRSCPPPGQKIHYPPWQKVWEQRPVTTTAVTSWGLQVHATTVHTTARCWGAITGSTLPLKILTVVAV